MFLLFYVEKSSESFATVFKFMLSVIFAAARILIKKKDDLCLQKGAKMVPKRLRTVPQTRFRKRTHFGAQK